jgi:cytochrome c556
MKLLTKDEMGRDKPNWGAQLAFHMEASKKMSCEACHPSHRLPTRGAFNKSTIQAAMQQANLPPMSARTAAVYAAKKLEIFHAGARRFVEDVNNCSSCHVAPQNAIHLGAASQSCLSCHADVTSWKTARVAPNQLGALFEGHPLLPKVEEVPGESDGWSDPRHKWIAGFRP